MTGSINSSSDNLATFTAESDEVVTGVCIKAGSFHSGVITTNGAVPGTCYTVAGIGSQTVTVTRSGSGPNCSGLSHIDVVTAEANPEVTVTKDTSDADDTVMAGGMFDYVIKVITSGTGSSTNVGLTDSLPDGFTYGDPVITGGDAGDTCSINASNDLTCSFGTVASGTTITVTIPATTDANDCGPAIRNTATVSSNNDTNTGNNTAFVDVTVVCAPEVTVTKDTSDADDTVTAGGMFDYVIKVITSGTGSSTNVGLTDSLPDGFTYGDPVITGGDAGDTCSINASNDLTCSFGTVASGTTITVTIPATTDANDCGPAIRNTATVSSNNDTNTGNNTAFVDVTVVCEELGSITVDKEIACDVCETFTPGFFFNQGENNDGFEFANDSLMDSPITVAGLTFNSVQFVQDNADPGSLLRHYLALRLNVRLADTNECDLSQVAYTGSMEVFVGMTIGDILLEAEAVLNGLDSDFSEEQLHDVIDEINNAETDDGTLDCEPTTDVDGFTFLLTGPAGPDSEARPGEILNGTFTWSDLPFGTYTLVETGGPDPAQTCEIVSATGDGVSFNPVTGVVTIVIDEENTDVTVTVVNACEGGGGESEVFGSITIIKNALPDAGQDFAFTTTGTGLTNFSLDDDADPALLNQRTFGGLTAGTYSVTESLVEGWTLSSITCSAGGSVDMANRRANITISGSQNVTCTFVNTQQGQQAQLGTITIIKNAVPDAGQDFAFTTMGTGLTGFSLDDDATATLPNARTFTGLAAGSYAVTESAVTGWTLTSITCSTGGTGNTTTRTASITLAAGANVTCTFVNTQQGQGNLPGQGGPTTTPRSGTLAGQLPNTATGPLDGSVPAALLALVMLSGLGVAAFAMKSEASRRR